MAVVAFALLACGCAGQVRERVEIRYVVLEEKGATPPRAPAPSPPRQPAFQRIGLRVFPAHEPSISLGFIGDWPLDPTPTPHVDPPWTRPFPCTWTETCGMVPPPDPYAVRQYGYPPDYPR
jgi:hypothetical protein